MQSGDLFTQSKDPKGQWEELEKRINRLLEGIVRLRNANAQLMKENVQLKNQVKEIGPLPEGANPHSGELTALKKQYDTALEDLKQVRKNLERMETLAKELRLED